MTQKIIINDPPLAKKLFSEVGIWSLVWLFFRVWLGWEWLFAGWKKVTGAGAHPWGPETILGFWQKAAAIPQPPARPAIAYDWYRSFLEFLINNNAESWMASLVAWGELLVGVALIAGAFVGIAATAGAFMNMNFMLAGVSSINPVMLLVAILLILAWKTAGWWGLDRWLLPRLDTPWSQVQIEKNDSESG